MSCHHGVVLNDQHWNAYEELYSRYGRWNDVTSFCPCQAINPPRWVISRWDDQLELERVTRLEDARFVASKKSPDHSVRDPQWYFATLTQPDNVSGCDQLFINVANIIKSKQVSPTEWCYSLELTTKGTPHIHMMFRTSKKYLDFGKIAKLNTNGLRGDDRQHWRAEVQKDRGYAQKYTIKDDSKPDQAWLEANGLNTWFFCSDNYSGPRPEIFSTLDIQEWSESAAEEPHADVISHEEEPKSTQNARPRTTEQTKGS